MSVFLDAAKVLQERGWTQEVFEDEEGRVCLRGALRLALGGEIEPGWGTDFTKCGPVDIAEQQALYVLLDLGGMESAMGWNDDPHVTVEDVILLLKRAAEQRPDL